MSHHCWLMCFHYLVRDKSFFFLRFICLNLLTSEYELVVYAKRWLPQVRVVRDAKREDVLEECEDALFLVSNGFVRALSVGCNVKCAIAHPSLYFRRRVVPPACQHAVPRGALLQLVIPGKSTSFVSCRYEPWRVFSYMVSKFATDGELKACRYLPS
jgi:hypothetical protein